MSIVKGVGDKTLISKLLAAGLSSAIFLIWWPRHMPDAGLAWLVLRGVLWTAAFELLLLGAGPLEKRAWAAVAGRVEVPRRARIGGWLVFSALAVGLLVAFTASAPELSPARSEKPRVVKQVIVKHQVKRVVVERAAPQPEVTYPTQPTAPAAPAPERKDADSKSKPEQVGGGGQTETQSEPPASPEPEPEEPVSP